MKDAVRELFKSLLSEVGDGSTYDKSTGVLGLDWSCGEYGNTKIVVPPELRVELERELSCHIDKWMKERESHLAYLMSKPDQDPIDRHYIQQHTRKVEHLKKLKEEIK